MKKKIVKRKKDGKFVSNLVRNDWKMKGENTMIIQQQFVAFSQQVAIRVKKHGIFLFFFWFFPELFSVFLIENKSIKNKSIQNESIKNESIKNESNKNKFKKIDGGCCCCS